MKPNLVSVIPVDHKSTINLNSCDLSLKTTYDISVNSNIDDILFSINRLLRTLLTKVIDEKFLALAVNDDKISVIIEHENFTTGKLIYTETKSNFDINKISLLFYYTITRLHHGFDLNGKIFVDVLISRCEK